MDKTLDLDELNKWEKQINDWAWYGGNTAFPVSAGQVLSLIAAARRPEGSLQNLQTTPAPQPPATNWSEFEDEISDAISDSIDMDWSSRDGARAVVALLNKEAPR